MKILQLKLTVREAWALIDAIQAKSREGVGECVPAELEWVGSRLMGLIKEEVEEKKAVSATK